MDSLLERIKILDRHRITYFLQNPNASFDQYDREICEATNQLIQEIPLSIADCVGTRAYLIGKILNIQPNYEPKCEEHLEQSLRVNGTRADTWLELGQCVWKRGDLKRAYECFLEGVKRERSAKALCMLSAALRAQASIERNPKNRFLKLDESLELCNEALQKRKDYSFAWYSLANTHLSRFFALQQNQESDLILALDAFENVLNPASSKTNVSSNQYQLFINPDLHLNYGEALYYKQNYAKALAQFRRALAIEPHFTQAQQRYDESRTFLHHLIENVQRKARLPQRRIHALLNKFQSFTGSTCKMTEFTPALNEAISRMNDKATNSYECATLTELGDRLSRQTENNIKHFALTVCCIGQIYNEQKIPHTFICIDCKGMALALTVYNCSEKFGVLIGDMLTLLQPNLIWLDSKEIDNINNANSNNQNNRQEEKKQNAQLINGKCNQSRKENDAEQTRIPLIRVMNPQQQLIKNGRPLNAMHCAFASLTIATAENGLNNNNAKISKKQ